MNAPTNHLRAIREALANDREQHAARPANLAPEFLPAALELVERPVSPTSRLTGRILLGLLVATLLWLVFGEVDVVASAPGKILPSGSTRLVQAAGSGVVAAIHVREGERVHKGQVLIELDTTLSSAELEQARKALLTADLDVARGHALVDALDGRGLHFAAPEGTPPEVVETQRRLVAAQLAEVNATVAGYGAARGSALADAQAAAATRAKLDSILPILDHEVEAMNRLDAKGYAPGLRLLELQRQRRSEAGDREVAAAQAARGGSEARRYADAMAQTREQARRQALADLAKAESEAILRREDVTKAARRQSLQRLVASDDGTVQQLALHTVGGVVEPARTLMVIVPDHDGIELEARVLNKDIGFVREGQSVAVKFEAFPFTRYGTVPGIVTSLSHDAVSDPRLGASYIARINLARSEIEADGKAVPLTAGLAATADIRTGKRRIISWLLSPLQTLVAGAAREK